MSEPEYSAWIKALLIDMLYHNISLLTAGPSCHAEPPHPPARLDAAVVQFSRIVHVDDFEPLARARRDLAWLRETGVAETIVTTAPFFLPPSRPAAYHRINRRQRAAIRVLGDRRVPP